ncbi:tyrosine-type recombinase/integrase [Glycomyces buryatensis]|uniref:Site-specific integrase n=1 Tax=Glycomyces buryatensis TaxID=2570927 RepID=A0A4S8QC74_9ACTN|nr:tyrosine-type recombinase/integrase [Glycomyces buryatensis]THV41181.1 site-specific integrase [Glycomyces buryatensis]
MGRCIKRTNDNGKPRFLAMYTDAQGERRSAGTFATRKEADQAWQDAEAKIRAGRGNHLTRGRKRFREYTEEIWLPNLTVEVKTRENYTYNLYAHLMDFFGEKQMVNIYATDIKEWQSRLKQQGITAANRKKLKQLLSSILSAAVDDEYLGANSCMLVKGERVEKKPLEIISPEQFDVFHQALPDEMSKLLVETAIETGMRWGELTELRAQDFDPDRSAFTVRRAVLQVSPAFHPEGKRFFVKNYPKNGKYRFIKIAGALRDKIQSHIKEHNLAKDDLLFWYTGTIPTKPENTTTPDFGHLGFTEPNTGGFTYAHGTMSAYTAGRCRCEHCRGAMAAYRRRRRAGGKDRPRQRRVWDTDGHIPNQWFRNQIIKPALAEADLPVDIRMHLLRHAHASWLLNGGADLVVVKERLGHGSIVTTERYLHTIDNADETALTALDKVRKQYRPDGHETTAPAATTVEELGLLSNGELFGQIAKLQAEMAKRLGSDAWGAA